MPHNATLPYPIIHLKPCVSEENIPQEKCQTVLKLLQ